VHFYGLLARQLSSVHQRHRKSDGETNWGWPSSEMLQNGQCAATGAGVRAFRVAARIVQVRQERAQRRLAGVTGPGNVGGLNNSGNDPSGTGNAAKAPDTPGTNSAGTANSSGSTSTAGGAPLGSTTVGTAGNPAGGATGGRIDGTVTQGPAMHGDDTIRVESSPDSKVDQKVKSICKGC
jgi:hypothetical protein